MDLFLLHLLSTMCGLTTTGFSSFSTYLQFLSSYSSGLFQCFPLGRYKATLAPEVRSRLEAGDPHVITTHQMGDALLKLDFAEDSRR